MGLHVSLEFTCVCAGVVALFANERLLSTMNQLFSSVTINNKDDCNNMFSNHSISCDDREDAKKTDNNVVKGKGCLIHVHEDINNLPPFPSTSAHLHLQV